MKKVSLVIVHFLNRKFTEQCLESVRKLRAKGFQLEVVVVNNNPQEDLSKLRKKFSRFVFMETRKNLGFTGGYNTGIRKALNNEADWILLVNNDTILDKDLIIQLIAAAEGGRPHSRLLSKVKGGEADEKIGILGPKIYFAPGYEYHRERYRPGDQGKVFWYAGGLIDWENVLDSHRGVDEIDEGQYEKEIETDFVSGCAMFVRREVFEEIGLLDDKYFLYLEDNDFCQRAKRAGFKLIYAPKAKLWHLNAGSSEVGGPLHDYYFSRNRMLFGIRYASIRTKLALIRESFRLILGGRKWQRAGIKDFYLGRFGKGRYET